MIFSSLILAVGEAGTACASGAKCCPIHAIVALIVALLVGMVIGYFIGKRRGGASKVNTKAPARKVQNGKSVPREPRVKLPAGAVELYVGNLSYDMNDATLRKTFEEFGGVVSVRVVMNKFNHKSKGFGFVVMANRAAADKAIKAMSEKDVSGRKMRVNEARNTKVEA